MGVDLDDLAGCLEQAAARGFDSKSVSELPHLSLHHRATKSTSAVNGDESPPNGPGVVVVVEQLRSDRWGSRAGRWGRTQIAPFSRYA